MYLECQDLQEQDIRDEYEEVKAKFKNIEQRKTDGYILRSKVRSSIPFINLSCIEKYHCQGKSNFFVA